MLQKAKYDKDTIRLIQHLKDVDTENLLSLCGYSSIHDYEVCSDEQWDRNSFIDQHFEDLEVALKMNFYQ